ncbi:MAG: isochorismatase family protein [Chloroflexi bacterium]|nr:isochorismatase family protein [Chloroflexota bacterium]
MTKDFLEEIKEYNTRKSVPDADRTALLVIDMQRYFRAVASRVLDNVNSLIDACRANSIPVIFTRHGHKDTAADGGMLAEWWGDLPSYGSPEWNLLDGLHVKDGDAVIDKDRYSAFMNTDLNERIQRAGVKNLIITGVLTNCCCETTARDAFMRDYRVFFVSDATAAENDDLHCSSLKNLAYAFAYVVSADELCRQLAGGVRTVD